jgi:hypothetical protein
MNENPHMGKTRWILVALAIGLCATSSFGQAGAQDLPGTIDWIQKTLGGASCSVFEMGATKAELQQVTENTEVLFSGCDMTLSTATTIGPENDVRTFRVSLRQLDPSGVILSEGIKVPAGWVTRGEVPSQTMRLTAAANTQPINVTTEQYGTNASKPSESKTSEIVIHVRTKESADDLVKALSRAITLCKQQ